MSEILIGPLGFSGAANGDERLIHFERFIKLFYLSTFCSHSGIQLYFFSKYKIRNKFIKYCFEIPESITVIKANSKYSQKDSIFDQITLIHFFNLDT